ncbi:MAG: hypothetical protein J7L07_04970 [Candidatus Odinarchaeota archaeon]|nr:hypothetical protein [Candidatus Odinarchaeota archaeon]
MIYWNDKVKERIPTFPVTIVKISNLTVRETDEELFNLTFENVKNTIFNRTSLNELKNDRIIRLYRDFYWKYLDIDPTKIRPSGEALARRILQGKQIPRILNVVDAYNFASAETFISFGAYDFDKVVTPLIFDFAKENESFFGIGMKEPKVLKGKELVLRDKLGIINIYPYRDSDRTKVTKETRNVLLIGAGVPGLDEKTLIEATKKAMKNIIAFAGGEASEIKIYTST